MMKKRQKQTPKHAFELMPPRIPLHDLNALAERDITLAPADTRAEYVKRCEELVLESLGRESVYTASREFWSSQRRSFDECMAFNVSLVKHSGFGVDWPRWFDEHRDTFVEAAKVVVRALPPESDAASYARAVSAAASMSAWRLTFRWSSTVGLVSTGLDGLTNIAIRSSKPRKS